MSPHLMRATNFLERGGFIQTYRNPTPRISPRALGIHNRPEAEIAPLPLPELQYHLNGDPAPDRGQTLEWPHPDTESND